MMLNLEMLRRQAEKPEMQADQQKGLYTIMTCMRDIRKTSERTDSCFEPLRDTVRSSIQPAA